MRRWIHGLVAVAVAAVAALLLIRLNSQSGSQDQLIAVVPAPTLDQPTTTAALQTVVLSGGCFWGMQGVFEHVHGVVRVLAGYAGGNADTAHYEIVSTGTTGHAESVQITFDPRQVSLGELLRIDFSVAHDPTELDRQGPDVGTQYRSVIFYADDAQRRVAQAYIEQLDKAKVFTQAIVTQLEPLKGFYPAEAYHQDYLVTHPYVPYIVYNDLPKIRNLQKLFPQQYQGQPVLVAQANH